MSEFLEALLGFAVMAASWIGWLLWQGIAWVGWLLWQGILLGMEHWWLTLLTAVAAVICGLILWIFKLYDKVRKVESQKAHTGDMMDKLAAAYEKKKEQVQMLTDCLNQSPDDLQRENRLLRANLDKATTHNRILDEESRGLHDQNSRLHDENSRLHNYIESKLGQERGRYRYR